MAGPQKITTFLWFNQEAEAAANLYVSLFKDSKILVVSRYGDVGPGPKGSVMTVDFQRTAARTSSSPRPSPCSWTATRRRRSTRCGPD